VPWGVVSALLDWRWSPQPIAGTVRSMWRGDRDRHVTHETIYTAIYERELFACLGQGRI
jgi:IS30 family transposase